MDSLNKLVRVSGELTEISYRIASLQEQQYDLIHGLLSLICRNRDLELHLRKLLPEYEHALKCICNCYQESYSMIPVPELITRIIHDYVQELEQEMKVLAGPTSQLKLD